MEGFDVRQRSVRIVLCIIIPNRKETGRKGSGEKIEFYGIIHLNLIGVKR
jgi:hypothetical protein